MTLRPVTRRRNSNELETARRTVSRAERRALDRAEELRVQAEELLKSAARRAEEAELAEQGVRSGWDQPAVGSRQPEDEPVSEAALELARVKEQAVQLLTAAHKQAEDLLLAAEAIDQDGAVADARLRESDAVLARAYEEAERLREEARVEAARIVEEGRLEAENALAAVHRQLVGEILGLKDAMTRTRDSFDQFLEGS